MVYSKTNVGMTPEILKRRLGGEYFKPITLDSTAFSDGECKAGTPIDADGKIANTSSAVGILLNDIYAENPNASLVAANAVVNLANAEANSGLTIAEDVKTALATVIFE